MGRNKTVFAIVSCLFLGVLFISPTNAKGAPNGPYAGDKQANGDGGRAKPVAPPPGASPTPTSGASPDSVGDGGETHAIASPSTGASNTRMGSWVSRDWVVSQNKRLRSMIVTLAGEQVALQEEGQEANLSGTQVLERRLNLVKQLVEATRSSH